MNEIIFQGQSFNIEKPAKIFFEKYISRIKKYAENHNISEDLLDDIYQSILEKLFEVEGVITQKQMINIVNSIGEPESIFEEGSDNLTLNNEKVESTQKLQKYKPWILGVCAWLAELTKIPVRIIRCIFFFLIFAYSFGFWLYLVIFLIRFVTDKENAIMGTSVQGKKFVTRLKDRILWIGKNIGFLIKWCWRLFVCVALLFCIGFVCLGIGLILSDLLIENQSIRSMFNLRIIIPACVLILSLSFWFIAWIFRIKGNPIKNRIAHFFAFVGAIAACIWIGAEGIGYIGMHRYTYNIPVEFENIPTSGFVSIETMDVIDENKPKIYYELYRGDEFKAEFEYSFSAKNGDIAKEIYEKANMPTVSRNEKGRVVGRGENKNLYKEVVPFNNPNIIMKITLPKGYQLDLNRTLSNRCPYGKYVYFDTERDNFLCENEKQENLGTPETIANIALESSCKKDFQNFAKIVHPSKGVTFYPYIYLASLDGKKLMPPEISPYRGNPINRNTVDNNGINLYITLGEYFENFVCNKNFIDGIATTTTVIDGADILARSDNLSYNLSPLVMKFNSPIFVKYSYKENFNYEGEKSEDLIFVLELYASERKIVAVLHS